MKEDSVIHNCTKYPLKEEYLILRQIHNRDAVQGKHLFHALYHFMKNKLQVILFNDYMACAK